MKLTYSTIAFLLLVSAAHAERNLECVLGQSNKGCRATQTIGGLALQASPNTPDRPDPPGSESHGGRNNGHGNGDQDAPGNSSLHNNAENSEHSGQGNSAGGQGKGNGK